MLLLGRMALIPNRAGVIENSHYVVPIGDGPMDDAVSAKRVQIEFVPSAQRRAVAQHEALEQRRPSQNYARNQCYFNGLAVVLDSVTDVDGMTGVRQIGAEKFGGRAQVVACIQLLDGSVALGSKFNRER
jgi:hypothetical protein